MPQFYKTKAPTLTAAAMPAISNTVEQCARCGGNHPALTFRQFTAPLKTPGGDTFGYWALCPVTGEPLLAKAAEANGNG